jgi:hypothetical protein
MVPYQDDDLAPGRSCLTLEADQKIEDPSYVGSSVEDVAGLDEGRFTS